MEIQIANNRLGLLEVAQKAPNRRKLYDILQKVYDLPNFGPMITTDYLRDIMKEHSIYLKVKRSETHTIPKGTRRNYHSIETLHWLVKILTEKGEKECGFTSYSPPNLEWMLRMIIWADPSQKDLIFKKSVEDKADYRKVIIEEKVISIDPNIKSIFESQIPCRSVTNQNYRMYMDDFENEEQRKIKNINSKMATSKAKAIKLKIQMERALQEQADSEKLLAIYQQELSLKKQKREIQDKKKLLRKRAMQRQNIKKFLAQTFSILTGEILQTPLVDKFLKLQMSSNKKKNQAQVQQNLLNQFEEQGNQKPNIDMNQQEKKIPSISPQSKQLRKSKRRQEKQRKKAQQMDKILKNSRKMDVEKDKDEQF